MELGSTTRAAARAAEAAQQRGQDAAAVELALGVCLQQPGFLQPDGRLVMPLLRVAKWLRALVARCCGGTLVRRAKFEAPEQAQSLVAWLAQHGALLDELELRLDTYQWPAVPGAAQHGQQQHLAARLLGQVPSKLRRLALSGWVDSDRVAAQQAAALAAVFSRQPMQLRSLELQDSFTFHTAAVLPALGALRQLTSLVMRLPAAPALSNDVASEMARLPAQLQQLALEGGACFTVTALPWLSLEHVTGLTSLRMPAARVDGGVLPRGLHALEVAEVSDVAPVLQLAQLTALQLGRCRMSAEQLRQLSTLRQLQQLSLELQVTSQEASLGDAATSGRELVGVAAALCVLLQLWLRGNLVRALRCVAAD